MFRNVTGDFFTFLCTISSPGKIIALKKLHENVIKPFTFWNWKHASKKLHLKTLPVYLCEAIKISLRKCHGKIVLISLLNVSSVTDLFLENWHTCGSCLKVIFLLQNFVGFLGETSILLVSFSCGPFVNFEGIKLLQFELEVCGFFTTLKVQKSLRKNLKVSSILEIDGDLWICSWLFKIPLN